MARSFRSRRSRTPLPAIDAAWVAAQPVQSDFWSQADIAPAPPPEVSMPLGDYGVADDAPGIRPEHIVCKQPLQSTPVALD